MVAMRLGDTSTIDVRKDRVAAFEARGWVVVKDPKPSAKSKKSEK